MKFNHLNVPNHWRHYWTKYPEGYTILEALLNWVAAVNSLTDNVNDWNKYLDEFVETFDEKLEPHVVNTLYEMSDDGTLDKIINETIFGDLNLRIDKLDGKAVNVRYFGAVGDGIQDDTTSFMNAVEFVGTSETYASIYVPKGEFVISEAIVLNNPIGFLGEGTESVVRQSRWGEPVFHIKEDGCHINNITLVSHEEPEDIRGNMENGYPKRDKCSGVYVDYSGNTTIKNVWVSGFINGVSLIGQPTLSRNNIVDGLHTSDVNMGILAVAQGQFKIDKLTGSYRKMQSDEIALPPHLIYFSSGPYNIMSEDVEIGSMHAWNGKESSAFQFKGVRDIQVNQMKATKCHSFLSLDDVQNAQFNNMVGNQIDNYGIYFIGQQGKVKDVVFNNFQFYQSGNFDGGLSRPIHLSYDSATDFYFENVGFNNVIIHTFFNSSAIEVRGYNSQFNNVSITHKGTNPQRGITLLTGSEHTINNIKVINGTDAVFVASHDIRCMVQYNPSLSEIVGDFVIGQLQNTTVEKGNSTMDLSPSEGTDYVIPPTNAKLFSIETNADISIQGATGGRVKGDEIVVLIKNTSSSTINVSFGWIFMLSSPMDTIPADSQQMVSFMYDGNNYVEISRSGTIE